MFSLPKSMQHSTKRKWLFQETVIVLSVGAVTVCVDEANSFMSDMYTLPNLLDQCAVGLVNNILLTGSETSQVVVIVVSIKVTS